MNKFLGWLLMILGTAIWIYGYLYVGHASIFAWRNAPTWLAAWFPNLESEIGAVLMCVAMIPLYWPRKE